jgi:hypothetical protein
MVFYKEAHNTAPNTPAFFTYKGFIARNNEQFGIAYIPYFL